MPTVLITGANRGLGLEYARQYAADGWNVIATAPLKPRESIAGLRKVIAAANLDQAGKFLDYEGKEIAW